MLSLVELNGKKHSEMLISAIGNVLEEAEALPRELAAIGVGVGPGSFTGIRVGLSTGMTIAQTAGIKVYGISSLDLAGRNSRHPVIRAFRDKYYYACYDGSGKRQTPFMLIDEQEKEKLGCIPARVSAALIIEAAAQMCEAGVEGDWRRIEPVYVMDTVYRPGKKKF